MKTDNTDSKQKKRGAPAKYLFKKGQSGNPKGRPKGSFSLVSMLKRELQKCPEGQDKRTYAKLVIKRYLKEVIGEGDSSLLRDIFNRIDGMPSQRQEIKHEGKLSLVEILKQEDENEGKNKE